MIINEIESLAPMVPIILHHHERYDGKGYPDGLKGEAIPIGARIVHVTDAYDTMVRACYRDMMTAGACGFRAPQDAGTQFDRKLLKLSSQS